jgi:hypothetical protein
VRATAIACPTANVVNTIATCCAGCVIALVLSDPVWYNQIGEIAQISFVLAIKPRYSPTEI